MAVIGEFSIENVVLKVLRDVVTHADGAQGQIAAGQPLAHSDQIRRNLPVIYREPLSGASEARHYFIGDHQDSVSAANLANALQVAVGWHKNAVGAGHGLENKCGDGLRALELYDFFEVGQGLLG